jgi:serine/threonine-protein kinase
VAYPQHHPGYGAPTGYPPQHYGTPPFGSQPPYGAPGYPPPGFPPPKRPGKNKGLTWLWISLAVLVVAGGVIAAIVLVRGAGSAPAQTTAPNSPVGPDGGSSATSSPAKRPPPSTISIRPSS